MARALLPLLLVPVLAGCLAGPGPAAEAPGPAGFSAHLAAPGAYDTSGPRSRTLAPGPHALLPEEVVEVPSALDGAPIQIGLVRPALPEGQRAPVVAMASPYFEVLREGRLRDAHPLRFKTWFLVDNLVPHGFAVALIAVRGSSGSGGCIDLLGPLEQADLSQALTWLGTQPWSNGAVGMIGLSYDGGVQWSMAATGNPHLRAIVPVGGMPDVFEAFVHNGTAIAAGPGAGLGYYVEDSLTPVDVRTREPGRSPALVAGAVPCEAAAAATRAAAESSATGQRDVAGFWAARDYRAAALANYRGGVFLVHGFRDATNYPHTAHPWLRELDAAGIEVQAWLGQWHHFNPDDARNVTWPGTVRWDWAEQLLRWFDRWLREAPGVDLGARVQVQDSQGRWRAEPAWPPPGAAPVRFHLAPGGRLAREDGGPGWVPLAPAPTWLVPSLDRPDLEAMCAPSCAVFRTDAFGEEFRFAGLPQVHVTVTPSGPGGHVTAYLYAEGPGGLQRLSYGQIDLRFAAGDGTSRPVVPGQPLLARLELEPLDAVVPAGAALTLALAQGAYGAADAFSNTTFFGAPLPTYPVRLELGGERSTMLVMALERPRTYVAMPWDERAR